LNFHQRYGVIQIRATNAFRDFGDLVHFILGCVTSLVPPWISLIIFVVYLLYQAVEVEDRFETYCDYLEYTLGVIFGFILRMLIPYPGA